MENQTRFDLNAAIESWRQELAVQPNLASDDRRELETHLRDAITGFQQRGLNDEESFWLARHRVGWSPQFDEDFIALDPAKVWQARVFGMGAAILFFSSCVSFFRSPCMIAWSYRFSPSPPHNEFGSIVFTAMIIEAIYILPIVLMMSFITRRRLNPQSVLQSPLFQSRLRFGLVAAVPVVTLYLLEVWSNLRTYNTLDGSYDTFSCIWGRTLPDTIIRLILIGLLVWLMPMRKQSKIERVVLRSKIQTRFDPEAAIENWRSELAAQASLTVEVRRELETHLRDSVAGFQQRGLNDEESFCLARKRVGQPPQLAEEFIKADPAKAWRKRAVGMVAAILIFSGWGAFSRSLSKILTATFFGYPKPISFHTSFALQS